MVMVVELDIVELGFLLGGFIFFAVLSVIILANYCDRGTDNPIPAASVLAFNLVLVIWAIVEIHRLIFTTR